MIRSKKFKRFNYGLIGNKKRYGVDYAPEWYLDMIKFPVHIFGGTSDLLVSIKDAKKVFDDMKNS